MSYPKSIPLGSQFSIPVLQNLFWETVEHKIYDPS